MTNAQARVEVLASVLFPNHEPGVVLSALNEYGLAAHEHERERVQLAILKLCNGDEDKLLHYVSAAKADYRDVLMWADEPPPSPEQMAADIAAVEHILNQSSKR
jgi:hypothetical protein